MFSENYLNEVQGKLSDSDFAKTGEVIEKQDLYSKSSRRIKTAEIWIPRLVFYNFITTVISLLCVGYIFFIGIQRETPLYVYNKINGQVVCAYSMNIKNGEGILNYSKNKWKICDDLETFNQNIKKNEKSGK